MRVWRRRGAWIYFLLVMLAITGIAVGTGATTSAPPVAIDPAAVAANLTATSPEDLANRFLPDDYAGLDPVQAAKQASEDVDVAVQLTDMLPSASTDDPVETGLAQLRVAANQPNGWRIVAQIYRKLDPDTAGWLAVAFPSVVGNLEGAPYGDRIRANRIRLAAAVVGSVEWPSPQRPWNQEPREPRTDLQEVYDANRQLIYFDPLANNGQGSWVELRGNLGTAKEVGVLVPGGSAFIVSDNFARYSARAQSFVSAADGDLAMIVWAGAPFPSGWLEESGPGWAQDAAPALVDFMADLRQRLAEGTPVTLAGHSYGGAIVGLAETYHLEADRVMHVASAGSGYGVRSPDDYTWPCRPRFDLMAPGDPIGYVQNVPGITGLGHGVSPSELAGTRRVVTGKIPDDPDARDDVGRTLGSQGLAGKTIGGVHAHSEVFIPDSDAWRNMLAVFTMGDPELLTQQPPPLPGCE